ncbi:unnamed protein product [Gordionus sp. m RMFG-2023]
MAGELLTIRMIRSGDSIPWGFRLQGGDDFSIPLSIQKVIKGSIAEKSGLFPGDQICKIIGKNADLLSHKQAQDAIIASRNDLEITIQRGGVRIWKPQTIVYDQNNQPHVKHSLQHPDLKEQFTSSCSSYNPSKNISDTHQNVASSQPITFGSSSKLFNNSAKPFGSILLDSEDRSVQNIAKSINTFNNKSNNAMNDQGNFGMSKIGGGLKAVVHSQYNSPINMYSPENVVDAYEGQTKGIIMPGMQNLNINKADKSSQLQDSAVYKLLHDQKCDSKTQQYQYESPQQVSCGSTPSPSKFMECVECSRPIIGVFVKANDNRYFHSDCFKCSTCGNSLKNKGYFSIHNKLYCDVHARAHVGHGVNMNGNLNEINSFSPNISNKQNSNSYPTENQYSQQTANTRESSKPYSIINSVPRYPLQNHEYFNQPSQQNNMNPNYRAPWRNQSGDNAPSMPLNDRSTADFSMQVRSSPIPNTNTVNSQGIIGAANAGLGGGAAESNKTMMRRGHGIFNETHIPGIKVPVCELCHQYIRGPYISALNKAWCPTHFLCSNGSCKTSLQTIGFVEEKGKIYCETCYERYFAPRCSKCGKAILGDCLNALDKPWHPECFCCTQCHKPFGNSTFYMENGQPYCERDWNNLFTIKCHGCGTPIEANQRWVEALNKSYHSNCFKCTVCHKPLEGQSFFAKDGLPFCKIHAHSK